MTTPSLKYGGNWKLPNQSGYTPSFVFGGVVVDSVGGLSRVRATSRQQWIPVTAVYALASPAEIAWWHAFYYSTLDNGSKQFTAKLFFSGNAGEYLCELLEAPSFSSWEDGCYASVSLSLSVKVDIDHIALKTTYNGSYSDGIVEFKINGKWKSPSVDGYTPGQSFGAIVGSGAAPRIRKNYDNNPTVISGTFEFNNEEDITEFFNFYYGALAFGTRRFKLKTDAGNGVETFVCQMTEAPSVSSFTGYYLAVTFKVEAVVALDREYLASIADILSVIDANTLYALRTLLPYATDKLDYDNYTGG